MSTSGAISAYSTPTNETRKSKKGRKARDIQRCMLGMIRDTDVSGSARTSMLKGWKDTAELVPLVIDNSVLTVAQDTASMKNHRQTQGSSHANPRRNLILSH